MPIRVKHVEIAFSPRCIGRLRRCDAIRNEIRVQLVDVIDKDDCTPPPSNDAGLCSWRHILLGEHQVDVQSVVLRRDRHVG